MSLLAKAIEMRSVLLTHAIRKTRHRQDAEDAIQNVFLLLTRKTFRTDHIENQAAYIARIAHRTVVALIMRRPNLISFEKSRFLQAWPAPETSDLDEEAVINGTLSGLKRSERIALTLSLAGYSRKEIAKKLDMSSAETVKGLLIRAKKRVREKGRRFV